ncbi:hypothetical protein PUNSTDRAFT_18435, partial [Punctularia strigosozonata HHB-11173 SS5]|uniref:uncharacterized protein n=1 Tax=Punctularia strigosozonata (strain HHB-11173) TaxID=741275 RepID=UPI000441825B
VIPGRAVMLRIPWHSDQELTILGVYAPNEAKENSEFWRNLKRVWRTERLPKPDMMMGDFNLVEDKLDRLPMHNDNGEAVEAFRTLKAKMGMHDGWRMDHEDYLQYSYTQNATGSHSRIDRIYAAEHTLRNCNVWYIEPPGAVQTDHRMVSVQLTDASKPFIGKGRWAMPAEMLKHKAVRESIETMTRELEANVQLACKLPHRSPTWNPQTLLADFKKELESDVRDIQRKRMPKIDRKIAGLNLRLSQTVNNREIDENERSIQGAII